MKCSEMFILELMLLTVTINRRLLAANVITDTAPR